MIPPGETDLSILIDMIMTTRCHTVDNINFHKLVLNFEQFKGAQQILAASYLDKLQALQALKLKG